MQNLKKKMDEKELIRMALRREIKRWKQEVERLRRENVLLQQSTEVVPDSANNETGSIPMYVRRPLEELGTQKSD